MNSKRLATILGAGAVSAALLVPVGAGTAFAHEGSVAGSTNCGHSQSAATASGKGHINNASFGRHHRHHAKSTLTAAQKAALKQAKKDYRSAVKAARHTFRVDTADERAQLKADLAAATTRAEKRAAVKTFFQNTKDERQVEWSAIKAARTKYRQAVASILAGNV